MRILMNLNIKNEYEKLIKVMLAPVETRYLNQQKQLLDIFNKYKMFLCKVGILFICV